jgi:hypothetical protein
LTRRYAFREAAASLARLPGTARAYQRLRALLVASLRGVGAVYEAAYRVGYDLVIITLPPAPRSRDCSCRRPHLPGVQASGEVAEVRSVVRHLRCARAVRVLGRVGARRMGRAARAVGGNLRRPPGGVRLARSRQRAALAGASETPGGVGGSIRRPGAAANASPLEEPPASPTRGSTWTCARETTRGERASGRSRNPGHPAQAEW